MENKAVQEATKEYNDLVAALVLIATSNRSKTEKNSMMNDWRNRMIKFNDEFSKRTSLEFYEKAAQDALDEARELEKTIDLLKKKLTRGQQLELSNLSEQLKNGLNKRLDVLIDQGKQLALKQELTKIRETKLGITDGSDRIQLTPKKSMPNLLFTNAKGQIVNMETVMRITVGDQLWATLTSSQRAEWINLGFRFVLHVSVMDTKTSDICIALNLTKRDLKKDQLPPMHLNCRSKIKLLREGWNMRTFLKNNQKNS